MDQLLIDIEQQCPSIKTFTLKLLPDSNTRLLTGIYKLYFIEDRKNRVYIGSAVQDKLYGKAKSRKGFYGRFYYHIYDLRKNQHHSPKLQNYVNKYGILGMKVEILEFCDKTTSKLREEYYIQYYSAVSKGFNCSHEGHTNGGILTPETRKLIGRKVSIALKGKIPKNWLSIKGKRAKPVLEFKNYVLVKEYKSLTEMCITNNLTYKFFSQVLIGKVALPKKYINQNIYWKYK